MALYEFTVRLDRIPDDDGLNALFEAGLDDSTPEVSDETADQAIVAIYSDADILASADLLLRARLLTPDMSELNQLASA